MSTWQAQTALAGLILAWNLIEAVGVEALVIFYARYNAAQYGLFGLTLISAPSLFFGPPSPVAYWSEWGELALMAGRGLGVGLTGVVLVGYYYHGAALCKLLTAFNVLNVALFAMPAFYAGASAVVPMWQIQLMLTLPLVVVGVYIEVIGATGPWSLKLGCPAWGANLETFNFVNALWFVPFVIGFCMPRTPHTRGRAREGAHARGTGGGSGHSASAAACAREQLWATARDRAMDRAARHVHAFTPMPTTSDPPRPLFLAPQTWIRLSSARARRRASQCSSRSSTRRRRGFAARG